MNTIAPSNVSRGRYQGMLQILAYNRRLYTMALFTLFLAGAGLVLARAHPGWKSVMGACFLMTGFWTLCSLLVSHWVYDCSGIYQWAWLARCLPVPPKSWVNIHAGLDDSSEPLGRLFPGSEGLTLDIFDPVELTEPSIAEARLRTLNQPPARAADFRSLPVGTGQADAIFLIFAAHEIRRAESRRQFFAEVQRALAPAGRVVLVEHLRDGWNFLAFGPGCFHFQSRRTWLRAAKETGLTVVSEFGVTPFVRIFTLGRQP